MYGCSLAWTFPLMALNATWHECWVRGSTWRDFYRKQIYKEKISRRIITLSRQCAENKPFLSQPECFWDKAGHILVARSLITSIFIRIFTSETDERYRRNSSDHAILSREKVFFSLSLFLSCPVSQVQELHLCSISRLIWAAAGRDIFQSCQLKNVDIREMLCCHVPSISLGYATALSIF